MRKAVEALREIDFERRPSFPTMSPLMGDDPRIGVAYTIGWIKAMMRGEEE